MARQPLKLVPLAICTLGVATAVSSAAAQEGPPIELGTIELEAITIRGTSTEGNGDVEVIDAERIAAEQPTTLNELFATSPEVTVSGGNRTAAQKVYIRGLEDTSANVTIDGAKQGGNLYAHSGSPGIDPDLLKRVEVEAGTGSALAGPGALGGVIRYETKDAEDLLLPGQRHGGMLKFSGQTNDSRLSPAFALYGTPSENFSYLLYGTKSWADNYTDGDGNTVPDSDSEPLNGLVKFSWRPADGHEFKFSTDYREDNGVRARRSNFGVPLTHPDSIPLDQELKRRTTSLRYSFDPADNPLINFTATVYDNEMTLKRLISDPETSEWWTRGLDIRNRSEFDKLTLTYGYDYTWDRSSGSTDSGRHGVETGQNHGVYIQADYRPTEKWLLSAGLRYDRGLLTDLNGNEYDNDHLSPNAQLRYEPIEGIGLFVSWSEAFRGVRPVEGMALLHTLGLSPGTDTSLPGEVARTAEIGFDFERDGWRGGLTGYATTVDDTVLYWRGSSMPFARQNGGDVDIKGFTARVGRNWGNWSADLTYAHSKIDYNDIAVSPGDWLSGISPQGDKIGFTLGYYSPTHNLHVGWTSTFVLAEKNLPASYALDELPAYDVHDLSVVWQPNDRQQYSLALTNIFDKQYLDHGTPYSVLGGTTNLYEMGRSLRVSAMIKF